jgi:hypothetical protein
MDTVGSACWGRDTAVAGDTVNRVLEVVDTGWLQGIGWLEGTECWDTARCWDME